MARKIFISGTISMECELEKASGLEKNYYACMRQDGRHIGLLWLTDSKLYYVQTLDGQKMYNVVPR